MTRNAFPELAAQYGNDFPALRAQLPAGFWREAAANCLLPDLPSRTYTVGDAEFMIAFWLLIRIALTAVKLMAGQTLSSAN
jgi:hypothetical protein